MRPGHTAERRALSRYSIHLISLANCRKKSFVTVFYTSYIFKKTAERRALSRYSIHLISLANCRKKSFVTVFYTSYIFKKNCRKKSFVTVLYTSCTFSRNISIRSQRENAGRMEEINNTDNVGIR
jgi:hypothetical protein